MRIGWLVLCRGGGGDIVIVSAPRWISVDFVIRQLYTYFPAYETASICLSSLMAVQRTDFWAFKEIFW